MVDTSCSLSCAVLCQERVSLVPQPKKIRKWNIDSSLAIARWLGRRHCLPKQMLASVFPLLSSSPLLSSTSSLCLSLLYGLCLPPFVGLPPSLSLSLPQLLFHSSSLSLVGFLPPVFEFLCECDYYCTEQTLSPPPRGIFSDMGIPCFWRIASSAITEDRGF